MCKCLHKTNPTIFWQIFGFQNSWYILCSHDECQSLVNYWVCARHSWFAFGDTHRSRRLGLAHREITNKQQKQTSQRWKWNVLQVMSHRETAIFRLLFFFKVNLKCPGHSQPQIPHTLPEGHVRKAESPVCPGSEGAVH